MPGQYDEAIRAIGLGLAIGETTREHLCPRCRGGNSRKRNFYVTREQGELRYICFRATCGLAGSLGSKGAKGTPTPRKKLHALRVTPLIPAHRAYLRHRFPEIAASYARGCRSYEGRVCRPIKDMFGRRVGWSCRDYSGLSKVKSLSKYEVDVALKHDFTYALGKTDKVIIVEDQVSAHAVHQFTGIDCLALLGSRVSDVLIEHLKNYLGYKEIVVALDRDARKKGIRALRRHKLVGVRALMLVKDPKDMTENEIRNRFGTA